MTNENVFNGAYAISSYSVSPSRSMAIVNYLMTNTEFRNAFQYGQRDVNYTIDKNDFVTISNENTYIMDPIHTGNVFLLYQNNKMTEDELKFSADNWKMAKEQMVYTVASPYLGFSASTTKVNFPDSMNVSDISPEKMMEEIAKLSRESQALIEEFDGSGDFIEFLKALGVEMNKNTYVKAATKSSTSESPYARYNEWTKQRYPNS